MDPQTLCAQHDSGHQWGLEVHGGVIVARYCAEFGCSTPIEDEPTEERDWLAQPARRRRRRRLEWSPRRTYLALLPWPFGRALVVLGLVINAPTQASLEANLAVGLLIAYMAGWALLLLLTPRVTAGVGVPPVLRRLGARFGNSERPRPSSEPSARAGKSRLPPWVVIAKWAAGWRQLAFDGPGHDGDGTAPLSESREWALEDIFRRENNRNLRASGTHEPSGEG